LNIVKNITLLVMLLSSGFFRRWTGKYSGNFVEAPLPLSVPVCPHDPSAWYVESLVKPFTCNFCIVLSVKMDTARIPSFIDHI